MNAFAQRLSQSGLKVVMPEIKSEKMLRIDRAAVGDVDDAIRWSAISSGQKVSVVGISFSGGLVVSAAANPDFADYVKATLCISGYNSIARVGLFYLREDVRRPDSQRYSETPAPNALTLIALQYLDELVPREDIGPVMNALRASLAQGGSLEVPAVLALRANQRVLLDDLLNVRTQAMRERYHAVLERNRAELDYISPMGKISQLRGSLYIVHGFGDRRIPTEEAEWTRAEAAHNRNVKVIISPWIDHSVLVPQAPFREKVRLVYFMSEMFDEAVGPVPLHPVKGKVNDYDERPGSALFGERVGERKAADLDDGMWLSGAAVGRPDAETFHSGNRRVTHSIDLTDFLAGGGLIEADLERVLRAGPAEDVVAGREIDSADTHGRLHYRSLSRRLRLRLDPLPGRAQGQLLSGRYRQ